MVIDTKHLFTLILAKVSSPAKT